MKHESLNKSKLKLLILVTLFLGAFLFTANPSPGVRKAYCAFCSGTCYGEYNCYPGCTCVMQGTQGQCYSLNQKRRNLWTL